MIMCDKMKDHREVLIDPTQNLFESLKTNSYARIRVALQLPCLNLNYRDPHNGSQTLLMRICALDLTPRSKRDLMRMVFDKPGARVDSNTVDENGMTALSHAVCTGDETLVRILASECSDIDPNLADKNGDTPLMHACRNGKINAVHALLSCFGHFQLRVNQANILGITPLMEAARNGFLEICRILVTQGSADVSLRDKASHSNAQDFAIDLGRCTTPELILLSPVAQRKKKARHVRESMGRSILNDFYPSQQLLSLGFLGEGYKQPTPVTASSLHDLPLGQEYIQQMNSIVFQVGKNLRRLVEDAEEEEEEEVVEKALTAGSVGLNRRRMSVSPPMKPPVSAPLRRKSFPDLNKRVIRKSFPPAGPMSRSKTVKLPHVPDAVDYKKLPREIDSSPFKNICASKEILQSFSQGNSPRRVKSAHKNESKTARTCRTSQNVIYSTTSVIKTSPEMKTSWGGKASTSVPSYLFR